MNMCYTCVHVHYVSGMLSSNAKEFYRHLHICCTNGVCKGIVTQQVFFVIGTCFYIPVSYNILGGATEGSCHVWFAGLGTRPNPTWCGHQCWRFGENAFMMYTA